MTLKLMAKQGHGDTEADSVGTLPCWISSKKCFILQFFFFSFTPERASVYMQACVLVSLVTHLKLATYQFLFAHRGVTSHFK